MGLGGGEVGRGESKEPRPTDSRAWSPLFALLFPLLQITGGCSENCGVAEHCTFLVPESVAALGPEDARGVTVFLGEKAQVKQGLTRPSEPSVRVC